MAKSFKELQNENKSITKQLSKCVEHEAKVSKEYKELLNVSQKTRDASHANTTQADKVLGIVPRIKNALESCKIVDKALQECKNNKYLYYSGSQTNKDIIPIIPYGYGTWVYDKIYRDKEDTSPLT